MCQIAACLAQDKGCDFKTATAANESSFRDLGRTIVMLPVTILMNLVQALPDARLRAKDGFRMGNGSTSAAAWRLIRDPAKVSLEPGRPCFKAHAFTDNVPPHTAWADHTNYESALADQAADLVCPSDVLIGMSKSGGSSDSVIDARREIGTVTIEIAAGSAVGLH